MPKGKLYESEFEEALVELFHEVNWAYTPGDDMCRVRIPLPPPDVQRAIVNIYNCANEAKKIAEEADRKSREVCPALIQHVINS